MKYLSDLRKSKKNPKTKKPKAVKPPNIAKTKSEPETVSVSRFSGKPSTENGEAQPTEQIKVRKFVTEPARVGFQSMISLEIFPGEWRGARAYVEIPCYVEELDQAGEEAMRRAKKIVEVEKAEIIAKASKEYFGRQVDGVA